MAKTHITIPMARLIELETAEHERDILRTDIKRLYAELQHARDGLTTGRTRMREDNERLRAERDAAVKDAERMRGLLSECLPYVEDARLHAHEHDHRRRRETTQEHEDRISSNIQANEDRRDLAARVRSAIDAAREAGR